MKRKQFTREDVEKMCLEAYIRGMSANDDLHLSTRFKIPKRTFSEWVKELIDKKERDAAKEDN